MSHQIESIAYANAIPWHGLGVRVDSDISIGEMLIAAKLDWTVDLRPLFAEAANGEKIKVALRRALIRSSDLKVMSIVGDYWKPFQNKDALEFFRDYCEAGKAKLETAGALRGGKIVWALANINQGFKVKNRDADRVNGYILLSFQHEVGTTIKVKTTSVRVVCANTLAMSDRDAIQYEQSHVRNFDMSAARDSIELARDQIGQMAIDADALSDLKLSTFDTLRVLAETVQPAPVGIDTDDWTQTLLDDETQRDRTLSDIMASIQSAPGAEPDTAWGVLNGVTHWADHIAGRNQESRLASAWFGTRATLKSDVFESLLALV